MPTIARTGSFQIGGQIHGAACFQKRLRILLPAFLIKISGQKKASLIQKHRVNAHDEIPAILVLTDKMPANHIVGDWQKTAVWALGTFDLRLLTQALDPFIGAGRCIARSAGLTAFETTRIDIVPAAK